MSSVATTRGATPTETALAVAEALERMGFRTQVTANRSTEFGAGPSADVVVRRRDGSLARLSADGGAPLSTDARQTVRIGGVDLGDGLEDFNNMNASAGSLEERSLIKTIGDGDPTTVDILIVNAFTSGTRQGEAFIESDGGSIINALVLDRIGVQNQREAWTQSHELGHVLLDMPFHPDNVGPDQPWLLMDSNTTLGRVTGPKRLRVEDCERVRANSGIATLPHLLEPLDVRPELRGASGSPFDPGYPRHP
jgi:hypothetical protein